MANSFGLQGHLDTLRRRPGLRLAYPGGGLEEFVAWQAALRHELRQILGLAGRTPPPVSAERLASLARYLDPLARKLDLMQDRN